MRFNPMNIDDYIDKECRKIAKMANKQLLRPGRTIYIPESLTKTMFKYLTKPSLERYVHRHPEGWYGDEIVIVNENTGWTTYYTWNRQLLIEYSRFKNYQNNEVIGWEKHLQASFEFMVRRSLAMNLSDMLEGRYFPEYTKSKISIECLALTLIHEKKISHDALMSFFSSQSGWPAIYGCKNLIPNTEKQSIKIQLHGERLVFKTDNNTYLVNIYKDEGDYWDNLKVTIMCNNNILSKIYSVNYSSTDESKQWLVDESSITYGDPFTFYGYDQNGQ